MFRRPEPVARDQRVGAVKAEVFVGPTRGNRTQRWRWDVTFHRIAEVDRSRPGLLGIDGRVHLGGECGYTFTQFGAWWAAARVFRAYPEAVV